MLASKQPDSGLYWLLTPKKPLATPFDVTILKRISIKRTFHR